MHRLPREGIFMHVLWGWGWVSMQLQEEENLYAWVTRWGSSCKISKAEEEQEEGVGMGVGGGVLHAWVTGGNGRGVLHARQIASKFSGRNACTNRALPTCSFLSP